MGEFNRGGVIDSVECRGQCEWFYSSLKEAIGSLLSILVGGCFWLKLEGHRFGC